MSLSNKKKTQSTSDIFDDDFEVIYEGDLPDISIDDDDDYRDVLSGLSDIDHPARQRCRHHSRQYQRSYLFYFVFCFSYQPSYFYSLISLLVCRNHFF